MFPIRSCLPFHGSATYRNPSSPTTISFSNNWIKYSCDRYSDSSSVADSMPQFSVNQSCRMRWDSSSSLSVPYFWDIRTLTDGGCGSSRVAVPFGVIFWSITGQCLADGNVILANGPISKYLPDGRQIRWDPRMK